MHLVIYDLSGIQSYIFATDKLKEIVGASIVVNKALFKNLPECIGEDIELWSRECEADADFFMPEGVTGKVVFIGGGNAVALFRNKQAAMEACLKLKKAVFLQSGGKIKIISADIEVKENDRFKETYNALRDRLESAKRRSIPMATAPAFALNTQDNITHEPVVKVEDGIYAVRSRYLKEKTAASATNDYFGYLCPKGKHFTLSTEEFRAEGEKSYLAIVHIDGNTMGMRISRVMENCSNSGLFEGLSRLRRLSNNINNVYKSTLEEALEKVFVGEEAELKFRPIIADGDDITFLCDSRKAVSLVKAFLAILEAKTVVGSEDEDDPLTACAGIAFVKTGFPFSVGYDMAEQCCKSAKEAALEREGKSMSGFDFHMCYGGATSEIKAFRNKNYRFFDIDGNECRLNMRPYLKCRREAPYSFEAFDAVIGELLGSEIPRSKLKGIRNAYGKGIIEVQNYIRFLAASKTTLPDCVKEAFVTFEGKNVSTVFDVLDIMDIAFGEEE